MKIAIAAGLFLATMPFAAWAAEAPRPAASLGSCVWNDLPPKVRDDFLKAYVKGGPTGASPAVLDKAHELVKPLMAKCAGRADIPQFWIAGAVGSHAFQTGALTVLAPAGIDRARLMAAWDAAPPAARACTAANAAKPFSLKGPDCPPGDAILAFLPLVGIAEFKAKPKEAAQVYIFITRSRRNNGSNS